MVPAFQLVIPDSVIDSTMVIRFFFQQFFLPLVADLFEMFPSLPLGLSRKGLILFPSVLRTVRTACAYVNFLNRDCQCWYCRYCTVIRYQYVLEQS